MSQVGNNERRMLKAMLSDPKRHWSLKEILGVTEWEDQVHVAGSGKVLQKEGLLEINEMQSNFVTLGEKGILASKEGLLEARLWGWISNQEQEERTMGALMLSGFEKRETGPGIGLLKGLGIKIESGSFVFDNPQKITSEISRRSDFIKSLSGDPVESSSLDVELIEHFSSRSDLIEIEEVVSRTWQLTKQGISVDASELTDVEMIGEITPEVLQTESWRGAEFKPFDVTAPAPIPSGGRRHPMQALIERIRAVFLEMGFSEIEGDYVQSAGWNMDALYIPQSHPARTMQDTFYLDNPREAEVGEDYLELWSKVHEHGRVFGIGRVFRQETIDRTHMPEFHQIEGIIHEPNASLPMLITTLKTFYAKMGYPDVRVRPAYFPYTEPSAEVDILWRGEWLELGGSGIFRPEVTEPLGTEWPVCAWGMGLERLAMLILDLDDIRQLYQPDLEILRKMPLL